MAPTPISLSDLEGHLSCLIHFQITNLRKYSTHHLGYIYMQIRKRTWPLLPNQKWRASKGHRQSHCESGNISEMVQADGNGTFSDDLVWFSRTFTSLLKEIFRWVVQQLTRFQLTESVARSLCDSWASSWLSYWTKFKTKRFWGHSSLGYIIICI